MTAGTEDLVAGFASTKAAYLFISFNSDWLYPPSQSLEMVEAARANGLYVEYLEAQAPFGHDSFLLESEQQEPAISNFLLKFS
jgi:homoserine O-acetyltransferase